MLATLKTRGAKSCFSLLVLCTAYGSQYSFGSELSACYRSNVTAKLRFIYLHGIDSTNPGSQELHNRKELQNVAKQVPVTIAVVRSLSACPTRKGKICWPMASDATIQAAQAKIRKSADACWDKAEQKLPLMWFGFSNGGYFVGKLFHKGYLPKDDIAVIAGAGGNPDKGDPKDLSAFGKAIVFIGTRDRFNLDSSKRYASLLESKRSRVSLVEYAAGHTLESASLIKLIQSQF